MIQGTIFGRLGSDPQDIANGKGVRVSIASSRKRKGEETTTWISATAWGFTADFVRNHCHKGDQVAVAGEIYQTEREGRTYLNMDASQVEKAWQSKSASGGGGERRESTGGYTAPSNGGGADDDSIPF